ncbi:HAD-IA family hydrolase [Parvularcula sp. IMCC14364]|uniref:HAD-IA family hydrolase n=1 Tax=Parvularcula sp. IMCC14364 TaxID=3067902 RepID=UPI002741D341|nr:HAD-IA family hydrolase [Parvularcula sp. IMCC14364]
MPDIAAPRNTVIIFDLDGTLVDSAPDLSGAMNHVLEAEGHDAIPAQDVRHLVGHGAKALLEAGLARHGITASEEEMAALIERFIAHYKVHLTDSTVPFRHVGKTLEHLAEGGFPLAVCTNKREELALPLLEDLKLTSFFDCIICRDSLPSYKPDPLPLLTCAERTGASRGVMVGDTMTDLTAAIAADMPCLIASFGYGTFTETEIKKARQFDDFDEIPGIISEIFSD